MDLTCEEDSPRSLIPKERTPHIKEEEVSITFGADTVEETIEEVPDDAGAILNDSFDETLSLDESSEGETGGEEVSRLKREKPSWLVGSKLEDLEQKVETMSARLKELEEENRNLRQGAAVEERDQVIGRLEQFLHNQNTFQSQQTDALTKMAAMFERHHREALTVMKTLVQEVSKRKSDVRSKKSK